MCFTLETRREQTATRLTATEPAKVRCRHGFVVRAEAANALIAPASLEALNALNSQNVDYIKYINSAGLHALNTLIQPAGIH